jgi:hypothetical protein
MKVTDEQIKAAQRVAEHLVGSCQSADSLITAEPALSGLSEEDVNVMLEFYGEIFLCAGCGWYCENEEMDTGTGEQLCGDCSEKNYEEE